MTCGDWVGLIIVVAITADAAVRVAKAIKGRP